VSENLLSYRVTWEVLSSRETKIGFYSSEGGFQPNVINYLYLICGSTGPALFTESTGSFVFSSNMTLYVAVDRDVQVNITVDALVPDVYSTPIPTSATL